MLNLSINFNLVSKKSSLKKFINFPINNACTKFKNDEICGININFSSNTDQNITYSNIIDFLQILLLSIFNNFFKQF